MKQYGKRFTLFISALAISGLFGLVNFTPVSAATAERIIFTRDGWDQIISIEPDGSDSEILAKGRNADVSSDGTKIVYEANPPDGGQSDIFVKTSDGTVTNLTNTPDTHQDRASWSPNGQTILYRNLDSNNVSASGFYTMNADGSNRQQVLPRAEWAEYSPDGTRIVAAEWNQNHTRIDIVTTSVTGSSRTIVFSNGWGNYEPVWSPDGQSIAWRSYCQVPSGQTSCISVMNANGSNPHDIHSSHSDEGLSEPAWSPNSTQLIARSSGNTSIYAFPAAGGTLEHLYTSPDGSQIGKPIWAELDTSFHLLDITPPTIEPFGPITHLVGTPFTLNVAASDDDSGIVYGIYWLGDAEEEGVDLYDLTYADGILSSLPGDTAISELPLGTYQLNVSATDAENNTSATVSTELHIVESIGLSSPTDLNAQTPTDNAPVLTWSEVIGATSYEIWREDTLTHTNSLVGTSTTPNFTDTYEPGVYNYTVVAVNASTSSEPSAPFQVAVVVTTSPSANSILAQGQTRVVPVYGADLLPGLQPNNTDHATFDFDLGYKQGALNVKRDFTLTFNSGAGTMFVNSTSIDWLVIHGSNNSTGTFQGLADVTLNGEATTTMPFTVTAVDGVASGGVHSLNLTVYTDSSRSTVLYQVNQVLDKGKVKIN